MEKIKIKEIIVVEGKYDKIKLTSVFDAVIITTDGFGIYKNKEKSALLRKLAEKNGVIILTDADSAGQQIRGHLKRILGNIPIKNAYIPEIKGKERRKTSSSAEGLLGVEGVDIEIIKEAVLKSATFTAPSEITKKDLYFWELTGSSNSSERRAKLLKSLDLPQKMTTNGFLDALNALYSKEELEKILKEVFW